MLIQIDKHSLVDDLLAHYRRSGFNAESVGGGMVRVDRPNAPNKDRELSDLLLHLRIWEAVNPGIKAMVIH